LRQFAAAGYPAAAREARLEADVELRLEPNAEGHVVDAQVDPPGGNGFDAAARAAALGFVFAPAQRGQKV
jgi:vitamin B12 transporter